MSAFWTFIILANVWLAASHCAKGRASDVLCLAFGVFWMLVAIAFGILGAR